MYKRQTWGCAILIFDLTRLADGPRVRASGLPGYPDNINRASDGGYWVALAGLRNPVFAVSLIPISQPTRPH